MTTESVLDDVNKRIIEQLQRDGRMSYAALAKIVGLSEAAVRQRVQRLLDNGVMQIVAVTDPLLPVPSLRHCTVSPILFQWACSAASR